MSSKKAVKEIVEKLKKGGVHFSTEKGVKEGAESLSQRQALRLLRESGIEAMPTGGMYKGIKEGSIFVPAPDEKAMQKINELARKTGQESILVNKPGTLNEATLRYVDSGKEEQLGKGFRLSAKQPDHEYWTKINTKNGPMYVEYGGGEMPGVHYGKDGLQQIDPAFQGTGTDAQKFMRTGKPETKYSSFYAADATPEDVVLTRSGAQPHVVNLPAERMYDVEADPMGFWKQAQRDMIEGNYNGNPANVEDLVRTRIKEAGYEGVYRPTGPTGAGSYEVFKPLNVVKSGLQNNNLVTPKSLVSDAVKSIGQSTLAKKLVGALQSEALKPLREGAADVATPIAEASAALNAPRQQLINKVVPQLDLKRGGDVEFRENATALLDTVLPDVLDAVPVGKVNKLVGKNRAAKAAAEVAGTGGTKVFNSAADEVAQSGLGKVVRRPGAAPQPVGRVSVQQPGESFAQAYQRQQNEKRLASILEQKRAADAALNAVDAAPVSTVGGPKLNSSLLKPASD